MTATEPSNVQKDADHVMKLRSAYYQLKTCNILSIVFAICGFMVFAHLYESRILKDFVGAMKDPTTLVLIVLAFLPAAFLALLARRYEKRYLALLDKE